MKLEVRCSGCNKKQLYGPRGGVYRKVKECVFCGRQFVVHNGKTSRIVRIVT